MEYALRSANTSDYVYCHRLTKRNMYDLFCKHWGGWVASEFRKGFEAADVTMIIIAGKRAGFLSLKSAPDSVYIDNIQLSTRWQRQGLGTEILNHLLMANAGMCVCLTTFIDNPAMRLYERLGFSIMERDGMTVKMEKVA